MICYLDQSDRNKAVDFIPVRFATLIEAPTIGDFVVLRMRVQQFAFAVDLDAFNREVYVRSAEAPKWPPDENATYATGAFWVEQSVWAENGDHVVTRPSLVRTTVAGESWTGQAGG